MGHQKKFCRKTARKNKQYVCKTKSHWGNNNKQSHAVDIQLSSNDENNNSIMLNELIQYYYSNGAKPVYILLLNVSKAFDKVSFYTLFIMLLDKKNMSTHC